MCSRLIQSPHTVRMHRNGIVESLFLPCLLAIMLEVAGTSPVTNVEVAEANGTEATRERAPEMQKPEPQPPQITFPFPFFPNALQSQQPLTFPFPFLFPSFIPRPSGRAPDLPLPLDPELPEEEGQMRRNPGSDKKKQKKKKRPKKPKSPKPIVQYQEGSPMALEGQNVLPGFAGQLANGNQGSYMGYYMVYLVEVTWNGSNQTQTIIAGRPILTTNPVPTESAQITDLSGSIISDNASKPSSTTQCLFQRSTTTDRVKPLEATDKPGQENNEQEIISEELETGEEYEDESDPKKADKKSKSKSPDALPIF